MRSIPATMTWEMLRRGGLYLSLGMLSAITLPALIFMALRHDGALDPNDHSMLTMHLVMVNNCALVIGAALFGGQARISRLYAYPLRTSSIVAWRMLPAMVIMAVLVALCMAILNLLFNLDWPIWGPALVAAVAMASVNAFAWLTEKSPIWLTVAMAFVGVVIGSWFKSRYGSWFSNPTHFWVQVTPADALTMLAASVFAYWIAVKAVARNRRGEPPFSLGLLAWLNRIFDQPTAFAGKPHSPFQAQCWFQWRQRGWVLPAGNLFILLIGSIVWIFSDRQAEKLVEGLFFVGFMLTWLGFIAGLAFGNIGPNDANFEMGSFLATRPTSDTDTARAILLTGAKSVAIAWSFWALAFALVCGGIAAAGSAQAIRFPDKIGWWYFPATLLGPWIVLSALTCLGLFGRLKFILQVLCSIFATIFVVALSSKFLLSRQSMGILAQGVTGLLVGGLVIASAAAFVTARRRGLIQSHTAWAAACVWIVATILLAYLVPSHFEPRLYAYLYIAATVTLLVMPIATAPLAISINRHR